MSDKSENVVRRAHDTMTDWLDSCTRGGKVSRNTIAIGIVVLHQLRLGEVVDKESVLSSGGEIKGARSGLGNILEEHGVPSSYLKEATTRQAHQDGQRLFESLGWGEIFADLSISERTALLKELFGILVAKAHEWMERQNLKLSLDRRGTPTAWINLILENSRNRSGGVVEQHLVGAKLARRFPGLSIPNHPAHAGDSQTSRDGDYTLHRLVFHVTAAPSRNVIGKCASNIKAGLHPILLVPKCQENRALVLAQEEEVDNMLTIISIEDYIALNIIELATEQNKDFFTVLREIVDIYNKRLLEVETDVSLKIDVH